MLSQEDILVLIIAVIILFLLYAFYEAATYEEKGDK